MRQFARLGLLAALVAGIGGPAVAGGDQHADDAAERNFENRVRPLLANHCFECHGPEQQSGGLRLHSAEAVAAGGDSGTVIHPGDPDASRLIQAVRYQGDIQMPPDERLSDSEIEILTAWVRDGAVWPSDAPAVTATANSRRDHWAFQPVQRPSIPDVPADGSEAFYRNPIDAFIGRRLRAQQLSHSPEADRRTLIRRVSYTLTGLPPGADDVARFVADPDPRALESLVDRLLNSPAYGEHWARHWLDVARYSDTKGYVYAREERRWIHAWAYRDWVIEALNRDLPFDRFLLLQIAADQVEDREDADLAAMGFLTLGRRFLGVQRDIIDDRIDVVMRGTMSLTVGCARCHDHKYDPIPTADYYSLYGVFASCRERQVRLPSANPPQDDFLAGLQERRSKLESLLQERRASTSQRVRDRIADYLNAQFHLDEYPEEGFDQVLATTDLLPSFVRRWRDHLRRAAQDSDPVFAAWHAWLDAVNRSDETAGGPSAARAGSGADRGPAAMELPPWTNPIVANAFRDIPATQDELVQVYAGLFADVEAEWTALRQKDPAATGLADPAAEQIRQVMYGTGSPCVVPDEPVVHTEYDFDSGTCNELWKLQGEVDRWIIDAEAEIPFAVILEDRAVPVTPRIFRRGDPARKGRDVPRQFLRLLSGDERRPFEVGSGRRELAEAIIDPENPLTARVIVNRVWAQHFGRGLVATPGDFGTRATPPTHPLLLDWLANRLVEDGWSLKRLHRLILTSGTFRQAVTGPVDAAARATAIREDPENRLLWRSNLHRLSFEEMRDSLLAVSGQLDRTFGGKPVRMLEPPYSTRRTVYGLIDRQFLPRTLRIFDFANPDLHIPQRSDTTVPQQALFLMNHPFVLQQARALAAEADHSDDVGATVTSLYQRVLQRPPTPQQLEDGVEFLQVRSPMPRRRTPETAADWAYGFGSYDESAERVPDFQPLPHFTGTAWQGGPEWPDATLGWVQLTADGGHPGNDRSHAAIRRWTAPAAGSVRIRSEVVHEAAPGDGIRVFVVSSQSGLLGSARLHQQTVRLDSDEISVVAGETIDFVADIGDVLNSDQFLWQIRVQQSGESSASVTWNAQADFPQNQVPQLSPVEQLAQLLLCSNEFCFVD